MRRVYLIRHAHPDFPLEAHMCLGRTDTPLGILGRMQALLLGEVMQDAQLSAVFSSPLSRCRQTAAPLGLPLQIVDALAEQDMGPWDGLDFTQIRQGWPELYKRRNTEPLLVPPGAETLADVRRRSVPALKACLKGSSGNLAIVAHASVIQALLAEIRGIPLPESRPLRPPYTAYALFAFDGSLHLEQEKILPRVPLTPELASRLLDAAAPGEQIAAHCRAVAAEAARIAAALPLPLDTGLLQNAALLHDVARMEKHHAQVGAAWLRELGYEQAARLVAQHLDLEEDAPMEAAVLYLADKCIRETEWVPLEERFACSEKRCNTEEARKAHTARLEKALQLREKINQLCGQRIVQ